MADETLKSSVSLRGSTPTRESFPPGSSQLFIDSMISRSDDVQKVANKASQAASGAYTAQETNDRQDVQISSLGARLSTAESTLQDHGRRITSNENDIVQIRSDVSTIQGDVSTLKTDVSGIKADYVSKTAVTPQAIAGPLDVATSYSINGVKVIGPRQTGWTAAGGSVAANIGAWNPNTLAAASATYVQAEATQTRAQVNAVEARTKAIESALRAHGLIN